MSAPRTKRPFAGTASDPSQRQITSYFNKSTSPLSQPSTNPANPLDGPVLPTHVQSNLLSVGMRVRKSVVEGYKTDPSLYSAFSLWSDADATPVPVHSNAPANSPRELAPFCGIHKVGGLAVQPQHPHHFHSHAHPASSPPSSQVSMSSTTSATAAMASTRKRSFVTEDEEVEEAATAAPHGGPWRHRDEWIDGEISPRSFAPAGWGNARVMAVPKSRKGRAESAGGLAELGQENMAVDDFEEAAFLEMEVQ